MFRLFKWLLGVCLVLALVLPGVIGLLVEKQVPPLVPQLDQSSDWQVELGSFNRGWFTSSAVLNLTPPGGGPPAQMRVTLEHGPVNRSGIGWLMGAGAVDEGFTLDWRLGLGVDLEARLNLDPWSHGSGNIDLNLTRRFQQLDYAINGVTVRQGLLLDDVGGSGRWVNDQGVWTGTTSLNAARLNSGTADLANVVLDVELTRQGDLVDLVLRTRSEQLRLDSPQQNFRDWRGALTLGRLHRPTMATLLSGIRQSLNAQLPPDQLATALRNQVAFSVPLLLPHQPRVQVDSLGLVAESGEATAQALLEFTGPPPPGYLADPSLLTQVLEANWQWQAPRALMESWLDAYQLERLLEQGIAIGDAVLSSEASFTQQVLTINGKTVEPAWTQP